MPGEKLRLAHPQVPREVDRYLVPTERVVFITHLHWIKLTKPVLVAVGWLLLVGWADMTLPPGLPLIRNGMVLIWLGLLGWVAWAWLEWYRTWFLSTDRRLVLTYGVIVRRVGMMPLLKVTDMRYDRSPLGHLLNYGTFVLESAGQDQALRTIDHVPSPDIRYRDINVVLFSPPQRRLGDRPPAMGSALPVQEPGEAWWQRR